MNGKDHARFFKTGGTEVGRFTKAENSFLKEIASCDLLDPASSVRRNEEGHLKVASSYVLDLPTGRNGY